MKNILTIQTLSRTAVSVLLAATMSAAYAQGNGNNQPSGQAGATGTSNVVVTNTSAQPVPTKDQNNGAYQPFTFTGSVTTNGASGTATVTVPAGKRLVIEHISGEVEITSSGSLPSYSVHTVSHGNESYAWANMT